MAQEKTYSVPEVAARLHVTRQTVSRWVREEKLRALIITVGARPIYRIRERDYRTFLALYVRGEED
jgi:excisionase family DNA binding protein